MEPPPASFLGDIPESAMRRIVLSALLVVLAGGARAEDFSGFYAGINAGYARGHDHDRSMSEAPSPRVKLEAELPPSARDAALALRRSGSGRTAPPSGY
ncbi:hypothetical protein MKK88_32800 [Methylobacterium sp. E-005]|uniref:hypothetical protein n=1 Tax=Methylobacterium sp. E-005 TaxID=2836549 RepID=UPI001FBB77AE|nr:hypothetical protein [Methylobacterium sp. E-005]MCJ2090727.1 hypothetical protein [Methylobacterium sp. E-005]